MIAALLLVSFLLAWHSVRRIIILYISVFFFFCITILCSSSRVLRRALRLHPIPKLSPIVVSRKKKQTTHCTRTTTTTTTATTTTGTNKKGQKNKRAAHARPALIELLRLVCLPWSGHCVHLKRYLW
jgi:hypothetical protein